MATDYDAPRKTDDELNEDSIEELKARRVDSRTSSVDVDETEHAEGFELPGADLSGEELSVRVLPRQADEFTCSRCFLVHHRSQLASDKNGQMVSPSRCLKARWAWCTLAPAWPLGMASASSMPREPSTPATEARFWSTSSTWTPVSPSRFEWVIGSPNW